MANLSNVDQLHKELEISWRAKMTEFENRLKDALVPASTSNNPTLQQLNQDFCAFKELVTNMLGLLQQQGVCGATNDVPSTRSSPKASRQQEVERRKKEASALTYGDNKKTRRIISKK
ncbi:unnamed protein product, partial [Iphiclides podalirius]